MIQQAAGLLAFFEPILPLRLAHDLAPDQTVLFEAWHFSAPSVAMTF